MAEIKNFNVAVVKCFDLMFKPVSCILFWVEKLKNTTLSSLSCLVKHIVFIF